MNRNYFAKGWLLLVGSLILITSQRAAGTGLVSGHYVFRATYAPVCLNGTYPITLGYMATDSTLSVTTDATGHLSGAMNLRGLGSNITGTIGLGDSASGTSNNVQLLVQTTGANPTGRSGDLFAFLHGKQFLGDAEDNDGDVTFTMDVSSVGPLIVTFDVDLTVSGTSVTGSGTASSCNVQVPVSVTGTTGASCSLHIVGTNLSQFTWDASGPATSFGFVASWNAHGFGFNPTGSQLPIFVPNAPTLVPYVTSRKDHVLPTAHIPAFRSYDINMPLTGTPGRECRRGTTSDVHQLVITFPNNITLNPTPGTPAVSVSSGIGRVSVFAVNDNEVVVNLADVANAQTIAVTLHGVSDGAHLADVVIPLTILIGDTNGDGFVDAIDTSQVKSQAGAAVTQSNFREDVNLDGFIDAIDTSLVKSFSGTAAVSPTPSPAAARPARNRYPSMKPKLLGRY